MGGTGRKDEPPKQPEEKPKKPEPMPAEDADHENDDYEDGDIATPKRDRHGTDDEPL